MRSLQQIIEKVGNLHSVRYKAIILESVETNGTANESSSSSSHTNANKKQNPSGGDSGNIPVTSKDSGDGSLDLDELNEDADGVEPKISSQQVETKKSYSENISVSIIHDGLSIFAVGKLQNKVCTM